MSKLSGLQDLVPQLENINLNQVASMLQVKIDPQILENKLGNRLLYPQTVPLTETDLVFDLNLLQEALKSHPQSYYSSSLKKIVIPEELTQLFPNLQHLVWAFVNVFHPVGITTVFIKSQRLGTKSLGTIIKPEVLESGGDIKIEADGKSYLVKIGSLLVLPLVGRKIDIKFESNFAKLSGQNSLTTEVFGGELGLMVDARISFPKKP
ncbi:MAG: hypothetical protein V1808_01520 [Candidatus Daviesbacteria bacterium]